MQPRTEVRALTPYCPVCFLFGYFLWQLDFIFCPQLTSWKRSVGMPWSFVFELHGWWHIFTAVGAYLFMAMVDSLTRKEVDLSGGPFAWLGKSDAAVQPDLRAVKQN